MTLTEALKLLHLQKADLKDAKTVKQHSRKALKQSHPDMPSGGHEPFLKTQEAISVVQQAMKQLANGQPMSKTRQATATHAPSQPKWEHVVVRHGTHFHDLHRQPHARK